MTRLAADQKSSYWISAVLFRCQPRCWGVHQACFGQASGSWGLMTLKHQLMAGFSRKLGGKIGPKWHLYWINYTLYGSKSGFHFLFFPFFNQSSTICGKWWTHKWRMSFFEFQAIQVGVQSFLAMAMVPFFPPDWGVIAHHRPNCRTDSSTNFARHTWVILSLHTSFIRLTNASF